MTFEFSEKEIMLLRHSTAEYAKILGNKILEESRENKLIRQDDFLKQKYEEVRELNKKLSLKVVV
ncbi:hypothetical protein [Geotoga petraea]|jgi:hypothetical protein|uniref:Uncharacterized protein n=1 Tax=Geotoga petraea TaxID=28234 RepID=A0A1G6LQT8_9BACT|nr:hypothetical protein [Geotoga petraea]SDC45559.1 hypothetical protein SAMN04488588_1114 [Geotoga petraea]